MTEPREPQPSSITPQDTQGEFLPPQTGAIEVPQMNEEKLLELLSPPPEKIGELHEQLRMVIERTLATTVNPHEQEALLVTADIIRWRLFAEPGSPLPIAGHATYGTTTGN